jgi:hypothetical protein
MSYLCDRSANILFLRTGRHIITSLCIAACCLSGSAQERLGITNSNYYSTASIHLNPASSVDNRTYMQLHLLGMNAYAHNNFAYLPGFSIRQVTNPPELAQRDRGRRNYLHLNASAEGPAFIISKRTYGAGFFVRARSVSNMRKVSYDMFSAVLGSGLLNSGESRQLGDQNIRRAWLSTMSWAEYGLNFGKMLVRDRSRMISLGGNLKYLTGIHLLHGYIREFSHQAGNASHQVGQLDASFRSTDPIWNSARGIGIDLGITYKKMEDYVDRYYAHSRLSNCGYVDYRYKIGLSLRDAGFIRFNNSTFHTRVNGSGYYNPNQRDTTFLEAVAANFNSTTTRGAPMMASLPTVLSGQFDYNFDNWIYLNVTLMKNLVPGRLNGTQGPDLLSVCPRFEMRQVEVALPFTLYRFIHPQLGLGLRYRSFVLGTDNLFPFFMKRDTYNMNIYVSLAVSIFKNPACKSRRASVSDCPKYPKGKKSRSRRH